MQIARLSSAKLTVALILAVALATLVAVKLPSLVGAEPSPSSSPPPQPDSALAGRVVHQTIEEFRDYSAFPDNGLSDAVKARQTYALSDAWFTVGQDGSATAFRSTTRDKAGTVTQDQLYNSGLELVNSYGWQDTSLACSETINVGPVGSGITVSSSDVLVSRGLRAEYAQGAERVRVDSRSGPRARVFGEVDQVSGRRHYVVLDADTAYVRGELTYSGDPARSGRLIEYHLFSLPVSGDAAPAGTFGMAALAPCRHQPPVEPTK